MSRWLFATAWRRLMFAIAVLWAFLMMVATVAFVIAGDWSAYVIFTFAILAVVALVYLVPRVCNWVEYRHWDARLDHYRDPRQPSGGPTEGEK